MGTALTVEPDQAPARATSTSPTAATASPSPPTPTRPAGSSPQNAFWNLTAADLDPTHLELPDGLDPAKLFETQGADAIAAAIENRVPLGDAMIDQLLRTAGHWSDPAVRQTIIEQAARVLAARGPETWLPSIERLTQPAPPLPRHPRTPDHHREHRPRPQPVRLRTSPDRSRSTTRPAPRHPAALPTCGTSRQCQRSRQPPCPSAPSTPCRPIALTRLAQHVERCSLALTDCPDCGSGTGGGADARGHAGLVAMSRALPGSSLIPQEPSCGLPATTHGAVGVGSWRACPQWCLPQPACRPRPAAR